MDLAQRKVIVDDKSVSSAKRMGGARTAAVATRCDRHEGGDRESLYAFGAEIESNAVEESTSSRLRKKLGREFVQTSRGLGYQVGE